MRVWFDDGKFKDFHEATHWEEAGTNWVELSDDKDNLIVILNWRHVQMIEMIKPEWESPEF